VAKKTSRRLDFEVDTLSNSIKHVATGASYDTRVIRVYPSDAEHLSALPWQFDWLLETRLDDREVFALTTLVSPEIYQGLISISDGADHIFMNLLEAAEFNKGSKKQYAGVAGNLVAYACHRSFLSGFGGNLVFFSKTKLVEHYEKSLGAKRITDHRMFIDSDAARKLVRQYHKSFDHNESTTTR
jgi:hypothetical protein